MKVEPDGLGFARDVRGVRGAVGNKCLQAYFQMRLLVA
jgi:hypothetical protein